MASMFQFNLTHYIRHLSFGTDYPGIVNPLDETQEVADKSKLRLMFDMTPENITIFIYVLPISYYRVDKKIFLCDKIWSFKSVCDMK